MKDHEHGRSVDGRDYVCSNCGAVLPDGALVEAKWKGDKTSGVRAHTVDGVTLHACGTMKGT